MKRSLSMIIIGVLVLAATVRPVQQVNAASDTYNKGELAEDQQKAERLVGTVESLGIVETIGPLAPVALSPFFGLACLSGTSMLCDKGVLPDNEFLTGNEVLNNPMVFLLFLGLTIVTSLPKMMSVSKAFAEAADQLETYAGIISYGVILFAASQGGSQEQEVAFYYAGIISVSKAGLLAFAAAINIIIINTVKFFFELLVLISPIPTLDAIFEISNKAVAAVLATIYAFNPWLAFVLNAFLFLVCLSMFGWINRRLRYLKAILIEPIWFGLVTRMLGRPNMEPQLGTLRKLQREMGEIELIVKCFPSRKVKPFKKKDRIYLVFTADKVLLAKYRLLRQPGLLQLNRGQLGKEITEGLLSYSIALTDEHSGKACELLFGGVYKSRLDMIREKLAASGQ